MKDCHLVTVWASCIIAFSAVAWSERDDLHLLPMSIIHMLNT